MIYLEVSVFIDALMKKTYKKSISKAIFFLVENREFRKTDMAEYLEIDRKHLYDRIIPELTGKPPEGLGIVISAVNRKLSRVESYGLISLTEVKKAIKENAANEDGSKNPQANS